MTTLLETHEQHFNSRTGVFDRPWAAALVAEQLRRYLHANTKGFDSRMVQTNGKHETTIEFPRHRHVWWPKDNSREAIEAELQAVVVLMKEIAP